MITLLVDPERFPEEEIAIEREAYRHLVRARRVEPGERLRVVDGRGRARQGEVTRVDRRAAWIALGEAAPSLEPGRRVDLLVATLRPERASWLVEKATELGVHAIRFLHTTRAPRTFGAGTVERLHRVAAAAVEQCGRARLPEVTGTHEWEELPALTEGLEERLVLDPGGEDGTWEGDGAAAVLVGPEGGWSEDERQALAAQGWRPAGLGPRVLRAETAAVVGVALAVRGHS